MTRPGHAEGFGSVRWQSPFWRGEPVSVMFGLSLVLCATEPAAASAEGTAG
jgi:hypothetical protein